MIRSISSVVLLAVLLFNSIGYRLLTGFLENQATQTLQQKLDDNEYADSDLLTLKIAAHNLGYAHSSPEFQSVQGQVELGGVQYNYVKRRFFNDSIELKYIPNKAATRWRTSKIAFFQLVNDLQNPGQGKDGKAHHKGGQRSGEDFFPMAGPLWLSHSSVAPAKILFVHSAASLSPGNIDSADHPPQAQA